MLQFVCHPQKLKKCDTWWVNNLKLQQITITCEKKPHDPKDLCRASRETDLTFFARANWRRRHPSRWPAKMSKVEKKVRKKKPASQIPKPKQTDQKS